MADTLSPEDQTAFEEMRGATEAPVVETKAPVTPEAPDVGEGEQEPPAEAPKPKADMVPHQALHSERERRKAAENRARELELWKANIEGRLAAYQQPEQRQQPIPDPEEDIIGSIKAQRQTLEDLIRAQTQQQQASQQQQQFQRVRGDYETEARAYMATEPAMKDAYEHLIRSRDTELRLAGVADERQRAAMIQQDEINIFVASRNEGVNVGERILAIAEARGWKKAAPAASPAPKVDPRDASMSLSGKGSSPTGPMTAERLVNMSASEFQTYADKNPDVVRRLMGA